MKKINYVEVNINNIYIDRQIDRAREREFKSRKHRKKTLSHFQSSGVYIGQYIAKLRISIECKENK